MKQNSQKTNFKKLFRQQKRHQITRRKIRLPASFPVVIMGFLVARHSSCVRRITAAAAAAVSIPTTTDVHTTAAFGAAGVVVPQLPPYKSKYNRWIGTWSVPFFFKENIAAASSNNKKLFSLLSHRFMSNKSTDDDSTTETAGEKETTTTTSKTVATADDTADNHQTNELSSLLSSSKSENEESATMNNQTESNTSSIPPPNSNESADTTAATDPEFNPVYVHPLSQIVLRHFQTSCHSWIVSKKLETLKIHRDGTFEISRHTTDENDPPLRIWTYYDNEDRKHWLSVSVNHVQHRFLLQDNLLSAWRGYKRNSLPERIQESVQELIGAVDEIE
jgi:hypothetical protein